MKTQSPFTLLKEWESGCWKRGSEKVKEKQRVHRKETASHLYSLYVCDVFDTYRSYNCSEMLAWCPYDSLKVVFRSIFAENRACEKCDSLCSNLLTWMAKWKSGRSATHTRCSHSQRARFTVCYSPTDLIIWTLV